MYHYLPHGCIFWGDEVAISEGITTVNASQLLVTTAVNEINVPASQLSVTTAVNEKVAETD